jgi:hypothetical protein
MYTTRSDEFGQFLRGPGDIQHNHDLHHAQMLTLMQPMVQEHEFSA